MKTRLHRSEVTRQLGRLAYGRGIKVSRKQIEARLGYPLAEAQLDDLRGIIATLEAIFDATESDGSMAP